MEGILFVRLDFLRQASAALTRLRLVRGRGRRTERRIAQASAALLAALTLLGAPPLAEPARADSIPNFNATSTNPFGLADIGSNSKPDFVDIDGDGDLDAFVGTSAGSTVFFRNTGSAAAPAFAASSVNPFGLNSYSFYASPDFCDIDGDGDLDAMMGNLAGTTRFFRNTGTVIAPAFAAPSTNPFGLTTVALVSKPDFIDIDGDGDLDAMIGENTGITQFFRNTGTAAAPAFAAASGNPFGLTISGVSISPRFVDIDADGDLDGFIGVNSGDTFFYRNTGTATAPAFIAPSSNPFGLASTGGHSTPDFADIDADGDLDGLFGNTAGEIRFFRNSPIVPTNTPTPSPTVTQTFTPTDTPTHTPTATASETPTDTLTDLPTDTPTETPTDSPTATATETPTGTQVPTATDTATATATATPSHSPTPAFATCPATPAGTCATSIKGQLQLRDHPDDSKDKLKWKFAGGPALTQADFGDPTVDASYALCVYDDGALKLEARVPADPTKWSPVGTKGYQYKDKPGTEDGVTKVKLLGGAANLSKLQVKGKGTELEMPTPVSATQFFNNTTGVTAQLHEENGDCYTTSFTPGQATKNDGSKFKAKF